MSGINMNACPACLRTEYVLMEHGLDDGWAQCRRCEIHAPLAVWRMLSSEIQKKDRDSEAVDKLFDRTRETLGSLKYLYDALEVEIRK